MNLEERFYTSTEVAEILGVSLRSVYRYLEEKKLDAEVKTATGRHRFTKENILDFLYPSREKGDNIPQSTDRSDRNYQAKPPVFLSREREEKSEPKMKDSGPYPAQEQEEPVDWLAKFREAATKFKSESPAEGLSSLSFESVPLAAKEEERAFYYRSSLAGLKDIAQNIDKSARKASVDYAFTVNSGMSLHKPIKPFSLLHVYVRPDDKDFFEKVLYLTPAEQQGAQLCLITDDSDSLYQNSKEMHGLKVVSDIQLRKDLMNYGEEDLAKELDSVAR